MWACGLWFWGSSIGYRGTRELGHEANRHEADRTRGRQTRSRQDTRPTNTRPTGHEANRTRGRQDARPTGHEADRTRSRQDTRPINTRLTGHEANRTLGRQEDIKPTGHEADRTPGHFIGQNFISDMNIFEIWSIPAKCGSKGPGATPKMFVQFIFIFWVHNDNSEDSNPKLETLTPKSDTVRPG